LFKEQETAIGITMSTVKNLRLFRTKRTAA
jgi:hypothetical protein